VAGAAVLLLLQKLAESGRRLGGTEVRLLAKPSDRITFRE